MSSVEGQLVGWFDLEAAVPKRDTEAVITALVVEHSATLYRVAYSLTRNSAEAEDMVQETFLRVLRHQNEIDGIRDLRVWLIRITWNLVLDRKRRSKTRPENENIDDLVRVLPATDLSADHALIAAQGHTRILNMIDRLPEKEREALLLSALQELSTAEIADVLKTTDSTVRSRIFRARKALAAMLESEAVSAPVASKRAPR